MFAVGVGVCKNWVLSAADGAHNADDADDAHNADAAADAHDAHNADDAHDAHNADAAWWDGDLLRLGVVRCEIPQ
jgi:hypothetical protein